MSDLILYIDESGPLLTRSFKKNSCPVACLGGYIIPWEQCSALAQCLGDINHRFHIAPDREVKAGDWQNARVRPEHEDVAYLAHLSKEELCQLFADLAESMAKVPGACSIGVFVKRPDVYADNEWLKTRVAHNGAPLVNDQGRIMPERVYAGCYQDILQRACLHAAEVDANRITVVIDAIEGHSVQPLVDHWHDYIVRRNENWGPSLSETIDWWQPTWARSDHLPGLRAADFVANAFWNWARGVFPPHYAPLSHIVRRPGGILKQRGLLWFPVSQSEMSESDCQELIQRAQNPEH